MSHATWVKLTKHESGTPFYLNFELAKTIWPIKYVDGRHGWTEIRVGNETWSVKETPEQIFAALATSPIYPLSSLPGTVFQCPPDPS